MDQGDVSGREGRSIVEDGFVSTLRRYAAALIGDLELEASFGDRAAARLQRFLGLPTVDEILVAVVRSRATSAMRDHRSLPKMRLRWKQFGSLLLSIFLGCVSVKASAMEAFYPALTKEALAGEWAGYWRGKPLGNILLISMEIDQNLRGTLARTSTEGDSVIYDIDQVIVQSGKVTVRGHDRSRPNVQVLMEGSGGALGVDGWLDGVVTDKRNDRLVFQVRLEKAPAHLMAKLGRMLRAARAAGKSGGK